MLLGTQAGYDHQFPMGFVDANDHFAQDLFKIAHDPDLVQQSLSDTKVGWLGDLGAYLPLERGILGQCERGLERLSNAGAQVEDLEANFDPTKVWSAWLTLRHAYVAHRLSPIMALPHAQDHLKPEALWEIQGGLQIKAIDFLNASQTRSLLYQKLLELLKRYDVLCLPSAQVWPFAKEIHWPKTIETSKGRATMDTYHRWMEVVTYATRAGLPTLNVPAGFNDEGLPMGLQLIGQPKGDAKLLKIGRIYEAHIQDWLSVKPSVLKAFKASEQEDQRSNIRS
jgi:amidase